MPARRRRAPPPVPPPLPRSPPDDRFVPKSDPCSRHYRGAPNGATRPAVDGRRSGGWRGREGLPPTPKGQAVPMPDDLSGSNDIAAADDLERIKARAEALLPEE